MAGLRARRNLRLMPLTVAIEIALLSFFVGEQRIGAGADRLWYVFCFALGLATLAKGLAGLVPPMMIIAPYLDSDRSLEVAAETAPDHIRRVDLPATAAARHAPVIAGHAANSSTNFSSAIISSATCRINTATRSRSIFPLVAVAGSFVVVLIVSSVART